MRIAMVGSRGIPARYSGVERVVEELTRELTLRDHEVIVYSHAAYAAGTPEPQAGRRIVTWGVGGKHLETISHTTTAMLDSLRRKVDVVHVHCPGPALMSWIPAAAGIPIVLTIHAADWRRDKWSPPAKAMLRAGLSMGMRLARKVTAVSETLAEELSSRFDREVLFVPNGIRPARPAPPDLIRQWGLHGDDYVLYVGRIVPEKRVEMLLRAWGQVATLRKLVVVGDHEESAYGRRCRLGHAGPRVLFLGMQFGRALEELYSNAALVVQPSALEGMSMVMLEAASFGRCILAADIPENVRVFGDCVLYFALDNVAQLADGMSRSLKEEMPRQTLGEKARRRVAALRSWATVGAEMERVYGEARWGRRE
jgi:glycosyltransferase involved in cell wall biosynthesis